jgi:hypothetical protein
VRTLIAFLALSSAAAAQSTITVTGKVFYEDRTYTASGFTGALVNRPVRQAEIDLMNSAGNSILATGITDENGGYSLSFFGFHQDARVRVTSQRLDGTGKMSIAVLNHPPADDVYAVLGDPLDTLTNPTFADLVITRAGVGGAFNIFDCAVKSFQYLASIEPTLSDPAPLLKIYWQPGSNGTFFDSIAQAIFLLGKSSDPDEYDDDIILHEIGHWVAFHFSKDDTTGGRHGITDLLDPRLSWSEGWAHYWSAIVRVYSNANIFAKEYFPNLQVDNFLSGGAPDKRVFDLEGPSFPTFTLTARNEVAVAAILWDLADPPSGEPFDVVAPLEGQIWASVHGQIPGRMNITLEDFHEGLVAQGLFMPDISGSPTSVRIFNEREVRYYADPSEPNTDPLTAPTVSGLVTLRTFYGSGDADWYTVDAAVGTLLIETLNLKDGADTKLELYDETGVTLIASDDNGGQVGKSSRIAYPVKTPTRFRLKVLEIDPIVEFGTYDLQVQTTNGGGGHGGCGLTGAEGLVLLALLRRIRRR